MSTPNFRLYFIPALTITLGGIIMIGVTWLGYYGIYLFLEQVVYGANYQLIRIDLLRNFAALGFALIMIPFLKLKTNHLLKAVIITGPLAGLMIAVVLAFYLDMLLALFIIGMLNIAVVFANQHFNGPWYYYYSAFISTIVSLLYAWPR